jgi:hypothetical protein
MSEPRFYIRPCNHDEGPRLVFDGEQFDLPPLVRLAWIKVLSESLMSPHVAVMDRRPVSPVEDE